MTEEALARAPTTLAAVRPEMSLGEQLTKVENIQRALREKVQTEKMKLLAEHDRMWTDTQHSFARQITDAVIKLERARDAELRRISDDYHEKAREIDLVAARLDD